MNWHSRNYQEAISSFDSDLGYGLTMSQAEDYLESYGPNKLKEPKNKFYNQILSSI